MLSKFTASAANAAVEKYVDAGEDLALRVYTTRLLGQDPSLVLHGGGNTSVKTQVKDRLGRTLDVICVKGSGWDMGHIEPGGLPAVMLEPLRELRDLESLTDEDMVNAFRTNLLDAKAPTPSVETLLHAFLPHKFIDHTHADAVLAIANQPNPEAVCREVFGSSMGMVPYIMPGFQLAKRCVEIYEQDPSVEGFILLNHGIFTFGETAEIAYERMIRHVSKAEQWLTEKTGLTTAFEASSLASDPTIIPYLNVLRGLLSDHPESPGRQLLRCYQSPQIEAFLARPDLKDLAQRGTITPDHVIRTKRFPLVLDGPLERDLSAFRARASQILDQYVADYHDYFETEQCAKQVTKRRLHPLPPVLLVPGIGVVSCGRNLKEAEIASDLYQHTIHVVTLAEAAGAFKPLGASDLFDMEYWSLEQAKLGKAKHPSMAGHVVLVTGAAGGIGAACARKFAQACCQMVLTDLDQAALTELATELAMVYKVGTCTVLADLTDAAQVANIVEAATMHFGGLDVVVSNAGKAFIGGIDESQETLEASMAVNFWSHQYLASAAVDLFKKQMLGGCLLFNASKSVFNPGPGFGPYSVAKAALMALMRQYAVEFAEWGIRASAVNADRVRTGLFDENLIRERAHARGLSPDSYFRANLLGREVLAEDVAQAFFDLAQAQKTTAAVWTVDGGNMAAAPR
jgi:rhamnose utilization protein RhaD (predicted bifunctional aldolase and dehydrogenase)/NAD(P)-dependent dehydrogenase (short-subunit alcohol dehydrogenase family)